MYTRFIGKGFSLLLGSSLAVSIIMPALAVLTRVKFNSSTDFSTIVRGGTENNGKNILYVCSAYFDGELTPGKFYRPTKTCYVPWGGKEQTITDVTQFGLLPKSSYTWEWKNFPGYITLDNLILGSENNGANPLYSCRAIVDKEYTPGKYYPPNQTCYVSWGGKEYTFKYGNKRFQILYYY
jgi:hypothetical protein